MICVWISYPDNIIFDLTFAFTPDIFNVFSLSTVIGSLSSSKSCTRLISYCGKSAVGSRHGRNITTLWPIFFLFFCRGRGHLQHFSVRGKQKRWLTLLAAFSFAVTVNATTVNQSAVDRASKRVVDSPILSNFCAVQCNAEWWRSSHWSKWNDDVACVDVCMLYGLHLHPHQIWTPCESDYCQMWSGRSDHWSSRVYTLH